MIKEKKLNKYFVYAFLCQFGILAVCIALHRIFINMGSLIGEAETVGDEMSDPTSGRLVFVILTALAFIVLSLLASAKAKKGETFVPFVLGSFAGTFLWQCIGEDLWNFSIGGEHFVPLEGISVLPIAILFVILLIYCYKNHSLDWGVWCVLLSFAVNWYGHYVLIGIYPLFAGLCSESFWCRTVGLVLGVILFALSIFLGLKKAATPKQKILAAILCYYAIAVLAFGMMEA